MGLSLGQANKSIDWKETSTFRHHCEKSIHKTFKCTVFIKTPMNITKLGFHYTPIAFTEYPSNKKQNIVNAINKYLKLTKDLRATDHLIITYNKPHRAVSKSTVRSDVKAYLVK